MPKYKETKMAKKKNWCGMSVILTAFVIAVMGCASNPSSPVDPQQFVGTWLQDGETRLNEITIRPDDTGSWTVYMAGRQPSKFNVRIIDGGKTLTDGNDSFPIKLNNGKMILANQLSFSKAQPVEVSDSVWVQENNAFEITYTFSSDGTYKIEYGGMATVIDGAQLKRILGELSGVGIDGTGTYSVSDHCVILKPNGGAYIAVTPPGNFEKIETETYTLVFVNGNELFHGYYYERK
jgi:hypothetical protein